MGWEELQITVRMAVEADDGALVAVAGRLVDTALATAGGREAHKVLLHVLSTNEPAIALYRGAGFEEEGRLLRQFHLDGRYVDDLIMARHLTSAAR